MKKIVFAAAIAASLPLGAAHAALPPDYAPCGELEIAEGKTGCMSFFDNPDIHRMYEKTVVADGGNVCVTAYEWQSKTIYLLRLKDADASSRRVDIKLPGRNLRSCVLVDMASGAIGAVPQKDVSYSGGVLELRGVPLSGEPVVVAPGNAIPRRTVWAEMSPAEIVDSIYRPWQRSDDINGKPRKMPLDSEPWTGMSTKDFLPCFDRYGQFKHREWPGKTHSDAELAAAAAEEERDIAAHPGAPDRNVYGGWTSGPRLKATGRFRTEKVGGKWWLVDPDGCLFWSLGAVRVSSSSGLTPLNGNPRSPACGGALPDRDPLFEGLPEKGSALAQFYETCDELLLPFCLARGETRRYDFSSANLWRKYGDRWFEKFSDSCHRRLRSWGMNTIANSSDLRICLQDRTPYAERVEASSREIEGSWGQWRKFRDPFDPSFSDGVAKALREHGREAHDKWCIGFFIDNEIQWGGSHEDLARWTLWSPDTQPAKAEFVRRLEAKGVAFDKNDPSTVPAEELRAFTDAIVEEYFRRTREAVKAFDPDLLYLGCRFAGMSSPPWVIGKCAKYCDAVSFNIYCDSLDGWTLPNGIDVPVVIGEFHFGAHDRGLFGSGLMNAGSQKGRAAAIAKYIDSALRNPLVVGVHWHQFSDQPAAGRFDGEHFQVGLTDVCDRPYAETIAALRAVAYPMYETRIGGTETTVR